MGWKLPWHTGDSRERKETARHGADPRRQPFDPRAYREDPDRAEAAGYCRWCGAPGGDAYSRFRIGPYEGLCDACAEKASM